jgi:hypothetical protein
LRNVADLTSCLFFNSNDDPGKWICWDFHELRVHLSHYTINAPSLKSWVIESSLDGENWTEIDRRTDNTDLKANDYIVSFAMSKSTECRFIRLTQTGETHGGSDWLVIIAVEFFGVLVE